ncbi:MAG: hypothetical protein N2Z22_08150 [Turneriella sp.]|nr:hypothetical protein [Turneriella sp.]
MDRKNMPHHELLALGKTARLDAYPCGHIVLSVERLRIGFSPSDFEDFARTVLLAQQVLEERKSLHEQGWI